MRKEQKVKNIIAFLSILFGESNIWQEEIMNFSPNYLIEKFERYILSTRDESSLGLNPSLIRNVFNNYLRKYGMSVQYEGKIDFIGDLP